MNSIVIDVWGGPNSAEHVARFHLTWGMAIDLAKRELEAGYLVNMRVEAAWGPDNDFDKRSTH